MKTNDELIADFIGRRLSPEGMWEFSFCDGFYPTLKIMKFKTSWDWLMPVVQRIEILGYFTNSQYMRSNKPKRNFFSITTASHEMIADAFEEVKIDAYYKAIIDFIKWYNEQKQGNDSHIH